MLQGPNGWVVNLSPDKDAVLRVVQRLFKLDGLELDCEDYGQAVVYRRSIPEHAHAFMLDAHHRIEAGRVFPVCGNTWRMLKESRLAPHFDFIGNFSLSTCSSSTAACIARCAPST